MTDSSDEEEDEATSYPKRYKLFSKPKAAKQKTPKPQKNNKIHKPNNKNNMYISEDIRKTVTKQSDTKTSDNKVCFRQSLALSAISTIGLVLFLFSKFQKWLLLMVANGRQRPLMLLAFYVII